MKPEPGNDVEPEEGTRAGHGSRHLIAEHERSQMLQLVAYYGKRGGHEGDLRPASRDRSWLGAGMAKAGKHCLPLLMANQSGWEVVNPGPLRVVWSGEDDPGAITLLGDKGRPYSGPARSVFGGGILSWGIPYIFRTPPGWNLLARGPANRPKDGASPLEGLVESDWAVVTFTMNWKLTRPEHEVRFEAGEPFCMLVPQRRGDLESFAPSFRSIEEDADTQEGASAFVNRRKEQHRAAFLAEHGYGHEESLDLSYFRGKYPQGGPAPEHQTKRELRDFRAVAVRPDSEGAPESGD